MKHFISLLIVLFACCSLSAATISEATKAYQQKNYKLAADSFESCIHSMEKADAKDDAELAEAYYNLGNCQYRLKNYPKAVLAYLRALRLEPANEDAAFNLELTRSKLTDRFDAPSEMFFVTMTKSLIYSQSARTWGFISLAMLVFCFAFALLYLLGGRVWLRKVGFFAAMACLALTIGCEAFAALQQRHVAGESVAVVMGQTQTYESPATTAKASTLLHEGTSVIILESDARGQWLRVQLPDGKEVWMNGTQLERV